MIGEMRELVSLQTRAETVASGGGTTEAYTTVQSAWAKVEAISGGRYIAGQQIEQIATHRVQVRYFADFKTPTYIDRGGVKLIIRSTREMDNTRRFIEYLAEEIA
jgi:SPP1 family predicted phage head-tail adaptor